VDAGGPVQALDGLAAVLGPGGVLSHLCDRQRTDQLTGRVRPPPERAAESPESPTLTHLPFEAILTPARESSNVNDYALVAMLGLLGLRTFEATRADRENLGEVHGHPVLRCTARATRLSSSRCHPRSPRRSTAPTPGDPADPSRNPDVTSPTSPTTPI
jgi:hypothetical protein